MIGRRIAGVLFAVMFVSCGMFTKPQGVALVRTPQSSDYEGNERYYYHSEGIKASLIYNDNDKAIGFFRKAINADSTYAPAHFEISNLLIDNYPDSALMYILKAVDIDTANITYKGHLARNYVFAKRYDDAMNIYSSLLGKDPYNVQNYKILALLYDYMGQSFTAITILDSAEKKLGRLEDLTSYKRELLVRTKLYDKAVDESKRLVGEYPYVDENHRVLAELYSSMGKDSLAVECYKEAMRIDSTNITTLLSVADFYDSRGNNKSFLSFTKRAFESYDMPLEAKIDMFNRLTSDIEYYKRNFFALDGLALTLLTKYPNEYKALDIYATHLLKTGEMQSALSLYKIFSTNNPDKLDPYFIILDIESYLQRQDSVAKYSDIAIKRFPDNVDLYIRKGYALGEFGKKDDAIKTFKKAYSKAGNDTTRSMVLGVIGDFYHTKGDLKRAYREYRKSLKLNPDNATVLNNYAYFLGEEGRDFEKALRMSERANQLSPSNSTFLDTQAWILYKLGRYEEAKKVMAQAVSLNIHESPVLLLHYGDILHSLGDDFLAKIYWKRALDKGYDAKEIEERLKRLEK